MHHYTRSKQLNLSSSIENLELVGKKNKQKFKQVEIEGLDKQSLLLALKVVFILNPFELNLEKREGENILNLNSSNLLVQINQEREGSASPFLLMECEREPTPIPLPINPLIQIRNLSIIIPNDL